MRAEFAVDLRLLRNANVRPIPAPAIVGQPESQPAMAVGFCAAS
jgi:hypothetical protein